MEWRHREAGGLPSQRFWQPAESRRLAAEATEACPYRPPCPSPCCNHS